MDPTCRRLRSSSVIGLNSARTFLGALSTESCSAESSRTVEHMRFNIVDIIDHEHMFTVVFWKDCVHDTCSVCSQILCPTHCLWLMFCTLHIPSMLLYCCADVVPCSVPHSSGICECKTGVYGPKCDECHPGFFHFSSTGCRPCQCHNHSSCHPQSGESKQLFIENSGDYHYFSFFILCYLIPLLIHIWLWFSVKQDVEFINYETLLSIKLLSWLQWAPLL